MFNRYISGDVTDKRIPITAATSPTTANKRFNSNAAVESKNADPKRTGGVSTLWIKKNQTIADKNVYNISTGKLDYTISRPDHQTIETDVWEKAELAKIIERYTHAFNKTFISKEPAQQFITGC